MSLSDALGFAMSAGFGLWWLLFPRSVQRFYHWFHRGKANTGGLRGIRISGALWLLLVAVIMWQARHSIWASVP